MTRFVRSPEEIPGLLRRYAAPAFLDARSVSVVFETDPEVIAAYVDGSLPEQFAERRDAIYFARTCLDYGWCIWRGRCRTPEPIREHVNFRLVTSRVGAFRLGQASPPR